jgi:protocatechuate 3,4-dioxygenase beta subunit
MSLYSISQKKLPAEVRLFALVDDPDGRPLEGARVTFTLSVPGIKTVTGDAVTDANGQASFATRIPKGADRGGGTAGVLVRTADFGHTTDETIIAIRK